MAKRLKRAFTITELVIVIAVVAILAAVLIPTFSNIINKANESADTQLVKNLNTILSSEQTVSQEAAPTMSAALAQAQSGGYTVDKLTPTSDGDILWEQESNRFVLASGGKILFKDSATTASLENEPYKFWKISGNPTEVQTNESGYSYYLAESMEATSLNVKAGIDVGENTENIAITYTSLSAEGSGRTVIFNTHEGDTLTVTAPYDTVKMYGAGEKVDIKSVDESNSFHLYAKITGNINLGTGHFVAENGSSAAGLLVTAASAEDVSILLNSGSGIAAVGAKDATVATNLKTAVTDNTSGKTEIITDEAVSDGTDGETALFAGGFGTESAPYLIADKDQFLNIDELSSEMERDNYYFRLIDDIDLSDVQESDLRGGDKPYLTNYFRGGLDGNGHLITSPKDIMFYFCVYPRDAYFKNITLLQHGPVESGEEDKGYMTFAVFSATDKDSELLFEKITVSGVNEDTVVPYDYNDSSFTGPGGSFGKVTFIDCVNNVDSQVSMYSGVFLGGYQYAKGNTRIQFIRCVNNAEINGACVSLFTGSATEGAIQVVDSPAELEGENLEYVRVYVEECVNNGSFYGSEASSPFGAHKGGNASSVNDAANAALNTPNDNGTKRLTGIEKFVKIKSVETDGVLVGEGESQTVKVYTTVENAKTFSLYINAKISFTITSEDGESYSGTTGLALLLEGFVGEDGSVSVPRIAGFALADDVANGGDTKGFIETHGYPFALAAAADGGLTVQIDKDSCLIGGEHPDDPSIDYEIAKPSYSLRLYDGAGRYIANVAVKV